MNYKAIIFNGPPRSGKDTAAAGLQNYLRINRVPSRLISIAEPIKDAVHSFYKIGYNKKVRELIKDRPLKELGGATLREEYIQFSESFIKPRKGLDFFGKMAVERMKQVPEPRIFILTDCGFDSEFKPIYDWLRPENIFIVKVCRPNTDFESDSRNYIDTLDCTFTTILNNGKKKNYENKVIREVTKWLEQ